jgi:hypothetical protein
MAIAIYVKADKMTERTKVICSTRYYIPPLFNIKKQTVWKN